MKSIIRTFPHLMHVNNYKNSDPLNNVKYARCFILRSNNDDDIHKVTKNT